ncbi:MAG: saccharopine dehydrogenase NADP-binding domain-containing protein [Chitinivibrionales bacterium]|nr:saccharopine dehydrogenase NADP-binding domain-containing protein [Chitinivibrionales bacterium]
MREKIRVVVLGTGHMGSGILELLTQKQGLDICGVYSRRKERAGQDVGDILKHSQKMHVAISTDYKKLLQQTKPDIVIQSTCSTMQEASQEIEAAIGAGADVITIAEEASFPWYGSEKIAQNLDQLARRNNVTVLGTGINPGFVLDLLIIVLTGVCYRVDKIVASRINDLSPYGHSVLTTQGVNLKPQDFEKGVKDGSVVGHFGFPESMSMIARALGWKLDKIEQFREPIVSSVKRESAIGTIMPGYTAGCKHTGIGYMNGKKVIELIHPQQVHPEMENTETGDYLEIHGEPTIKFSGVPEIPGGKGTIALAVNMIPKVLDAESGFKTMADLPVPSALMADVRELVRK